MIRSIDTECQRCSLKLKAKVTELRPTLSTLEMWLFIFEPTPSTSLSGLVTKKLLRLHSKKLVEKIILTISSTVISPKKS